MITYSVGEAKALAEAETFRDLKTQGRAKLVDNSVVYSATEYEEQEYGV